MNASRYSEATQYCKRKADRFLGLYLVSSLVSEIVISSVLLEIVESRVVEDQSRQVVQGMFVSTTAMPKWISSVAWDR